MFSNFSDALAFVVGIGFFVVLVCLPIIIVKALRTKIIILENIIVEQYETEEELY